MSDGGSSLAGGNGLNECSIVFPFREEFNVSAPSSPPSQIPPSMRLTTHEPTASPSITRQDIRKVFFLVAHWNMRRLAGCCRDGGAAERAER